MDFYKKISDSYISFNLHFIIITKEEYPSISKLKQKLRELTHVHTDFFKRANGFYNDVLSFSFFKEGSRPATNAPSSAYHIDSEDMASALADGVLKFLKKYYEKKTYYAIKSCGDGDYVLKTFELNEFEFMRKLESLGRVQCDSIFDIFEDETEAWRSVYRHISNELSKIYKNARYLKKKQKEIEEKITRKK